MIWQSPLPPDAIASALSPNQVHVWRASLALASQIAPRGHHWLSPDEQRRAQALRFERDRHRFVASRAMLRHILSLYLRCPAETIEFTYGAKGKPFLAPHCQGHPATPLQFNLSHSGEMALYAIGHHPLGIDIEHLKARWENKVTGRSRLDGLVRRCLTPTEQKAWAQVPAAEQPTTFLRFWTCKEAYLKAVGDGLTQAMTQVEIDFCPHPILRRHPQTPLLSPWTLAALEPGSGSVAAIAIATTDCQITGWDYKPGPSPNLDLV